MIFRIYGKFEGLTLTKRVKYTRRGNCQLIRSEKKGNNSLFWPNLQVCRTAGTNRIIGSLVYKKVAKKLIIIILTGYPAGVFIILGENLD